MLNTREDFLNLAVDHKIICFGAGEFLKQIAAFLYANHLEIDKLIDSSPNKWATRSEGCEIQSPDILGDISRKEYMILISSKNFSEEIADQINNGYPDKFIIFRWPLEVKENVDFDEHLWRERIYGTCMSTYKEIAKNRTNTEEYIKEKEKFLADKEKVVLPRTPLIITTRCTLCCKECSNLVPYYSSPKDYAFDEIIQWIKNICSAVDEWICCELVGGEPFLYRDLKRVLSYVLQENKIQQIEFTTNASVIPEPDILRLLKNEKVIVMISEYPGLIDATKFIHILEEYGVHYRVIRDMRWIRTKNLMKRNRSHQELQSQYLNCGPAKMCRTILNGKLYVCSKAASLMELGYVDHLEKIDLTDVNHLRDNIKKFLRLTFSEACDYCDMASADEEIIDAAVQIRKR